MTRLFIENYELDLTNDYSHQLTFSVDDLNNFDSKSTAFSKTIILPATSKNNRLLGNIFEFSNSNFTNDALPNVLYNFNASKSAKTRLEVNGLLVMKGVMRLLQIVIDGQVTEYEVALFGELGGFVAKLGSKKITDNVNATDNLDFSEYNHTYGTNNIINSWDGIFSDKIIYNQSGYFRFAYWQSLSGYFNLLILNGDLSSLFYAGQNLQFESNNNNNTTPFAVVDHVQYGGQFTYIYFTLTDYLVINEENTNNLKITEVYQLKDGYGFIYPLIDYGLVSTNKTDYQYSAFRPALYVREYIDKIITGAGYTWQSDFFNTEFFKRLIIPNNEKGLFKKGVTNYIDALANTTHSYSQPYVLYRAIKIIGFDSWTLNQFNANNTGTSPNNATTFTYTGLLDSSIKLNIIINSEYIYSRTYASTDFSNFQIRRIRNGITEVIYNEQIPHGLRFGAYAYNTTIELITDIKYLDTIFLCFDIVPKYPDTRLSPSSINLFNCSLTAIKDPPEFVEYSIGDDILMNDLLPKNIQQRDFFTSILKMFNLFVTEDKFIEKHLIIEPFINFYNLDPSSYLDWSLKVDRSQPIKIKPMSEVNSRYYTLKYKSDSDHYNDQYKKKYNEGYGDRTFDNQLEFAKDTSSSEVIFSATTLVGYPNKDKVVSTILKLTKNGTEYIEEPISHNIRVHQFKIIEDVEQWDILSGTNILESNLQKYCYSGHFDDPDVPSADINFGATKELYFNLVSGALGNNLFNTYYSSYMAEITDKDSRLVTCKMKLTESDIHNLNFGKFIYIDGVLYRLQKISDYANGELSEVQLLRVIYTTYADMTSSPDITECLEEETSVCILQENNFNISIE